MRSIERYLLTWIMGALVLGSLAIVLVTYLVTLEEMNEIYNADLKNVAEALGAYNHSGRSAEELAKEPPILRSDVPDRIEIVTITWTGDGRPVFSSDPRVKIPFANVEALSEIRVESQDWIVYTDVSANGVAQAAQRSSARHEIAAEAASTILPPMIGLVLVVAGLMLVALRRGMRPLDTSARELAARSSTSLIPIDVTEVPREIVPLVSSINDLMGRLSVAFSAQRRFLADAAHELRTPTTALRLQLQLLERAPDPAAREVAMAELKAGVERSQRLIEQLLHVARTGPDGEVIRRDRVDLGDLVRTVVGTLSIKADQHGIDLGAIVAPAIAIHGDANQLTVLLNNLVENALRYTPRGGVVDVEVGMYDGKPMLRVIDNGPGIQESERGHVFERFYRSHEAARLAADSGGSGLGLAIVHAIAERHDAVVSLHTAGSGRGLEVRLLFSKLFVAAASSDDLQAGVATP